MKGNDINELGSTVAIPPELSADPRYRLVERILHSRSLAKAARLRELLQFIAVRTLLGHPEEVTEMVIGRRLFSRGEDYIPSEDSIVRGAVRQLRIKLKEYFETEGSGEEWQIEIPKGGFATSFRRVKPAAGSEVRGRRRWGRWLALAVAANLVGLAGNVWWAARQAREGRSGAQAPTIVSAMISGARGPVTVVVSDFSVVLLKGLTRDAPYSLNDYVMWNYEKLKPRQEDGPEAARVAETLRTHRITRLGDLSVALGIVRAGGASAQILVRHARDMNARDFGDGSSILLGNWNSTPWFDLFEDKLSFPHVRNAPGIGFGNRSPRAGEPAEFLVNDAGKEHGVGYGRLALVPSLSGRGAVLLISGLNMVTMESAGEYALSPAGSREVLRALGASSLEALPYFEILLETHAVDNAPGRARIVASRNLGPRPR